MTTKLHQSFASFGSADADDVDPFALLMIEMGHKARARAQRDFDLEIPVMEGGAAFIRGGASPMEFATYVRAYANAWHRSQGHDDLVLPEAIN